LATKISLECVRPAKDEHVSENSKRDDERDDVFPADAGQDFGCTRAAS
jgi:hypothetical protein